jgi:hypothetical protein
MPTWGVLLVEACLMTRADEPAVSAALVRRL